MFDRPAGSDGPADLGNGELVEAGAFDVPAPVRRPSRFALSNWPVAWKVLAIAVVPLLLAAVFGGLRVYSSAVEARDLRTAADRAELLPSISDYLAALENVLVTNAAGNDTGAAMSDFNTRHRAMADRLDDLAPVPDVRLAVTTLLDNGTALLAKTTTDELDLRQQVTTYAPLLLTAETAITGSVRVDDENLRAQAEGLSRAVGARGQMTMQRMLIERGGELPEPELRSSMIALAGTEPSTVGGMSELLGGASDDANTLRSQMVQRISLMSDPAQQVAGNQALLDSIGTTDQIAQRLIANTTTAITTTVDAEANDKRNDAIRVGLAVLAAFLIALAIVLWVARSLVRPLRALRDGALKIAHQDLATEIERVKAGDEREPAQLPIHTTEEVGQVAHAVDELHTQALMLAGDEARLRVMVNDMFETMSRRNKTLVDQQLSLIDGLERDEEDPGRLDSLFRLDHLATRMRRNGANLLVLAGAQTSREHSNPVPLASLINAAASEVEEYQRVEVSAVAESSVVGAAATDTVHLLAELIDNALRYSPPTEPVDVRALHTANGGVLVEVDDAGIGMTDADLRIANMRLTAGGEVSPESARHMGLFVAGRLARQHDITVRLIAGGTGIGTTAQLYLPPTLLEGGAAGPDYRPESPADSAPLAAAMDPIIEPQPAVSPLLFGPPDEAPGTETPAVEDTALQPDSEAPVPSPEVSSSTELPRRDPGSSGIAGAPGERPFDEPGAAPSSEPWLAAPTAEQPDRPANTARFFSSRGRLRRDSADLADPTPEAEPDQPVDSGMVEQYDDGPEAVAVQSVSNDPERPEEAPPAVVHESDPDDLIYQNMLSEWLVDPQELAVAPDWKSVWDNGWAAAAEAESRPVQVHTDLGLPVREPGARLVPGAASDEIGVASDGGPHPDDDAGERQGIDRDPEAIRASISNHFGGVRAARSHAHDTTEGPDE